MINFTERIKNKNVIVLGGLGFVGHNLVKKLVKTYNCDVTVIDNCFNSSETILQDIQDKFIFIKKSVLDEDIFPELNKANFIFHLACVQINHSAKDPQLDLEVNALSTLKLLEYIRHNYLPNLHRFIYTSTASIYGSAISLPIMESNSPHILNHYAATKLLAENYVMLYNIQYDLPTTVVRYSNVYGTGQTPNNFYCGVMGKFLQQALKREHLTIYGDGEQTRDYTFIDDAINATILAAVHPKALGDVFNIGTSTETSVNQIITWMSEHISNIKVDYLPERDIDNIRRRALSIAKIHEKLGWLPLTNVQQGLKKTFDWYKRIK